MADNPFAVTTQPAPAPAGPEKSTNPFGAALQNVGLTVGPDVGQPNIFVSALSNAADVLLRGQYASAKFADALADDSEGLLGDLYAAGKELISPQDRLSYSDVIKRRAPDFAKNNPTATSILGFVGDIAFDPLTYLGIGLAGDGLKVGGKVLSRAGLEAVERAGATVGGDLVGQVLTRGGAEATNLVASRKNDIAKFFASMGVKDPAIIDRGAAELAQLETLADLRRAEKAGDDLARELTGPEIRERAQDRIARLINLDSASAKEFADPTRLRVNLYPLTQFAPGVKVGLPFSETALRLLGVDKLVDTVKGLSKIEPIGKAVGLISRDAQLPEEFLKLRRGIENDLDYLVGDAGQSVNKLLTQVPKEGRDAINRALRDVEGQRVAAEAAGNPLTQGQLVQAQQRALQTLKPEERAIVAQMQMGYARLAELEKRANLLGSSINRFDPKVYDAIADGTQFQKLREFEITPTLELFPGQGLQVNNIQQAIKQGATPDLDAFALYAQRIAASRQKLAVKNFSDSVDVLFPGGFKNLSPRMQGDIKFIGDGLYGRGLTDQTKSVLQVYDGLLRPFRTFATVAKVSFGPKQLLANANQAAVEAGLKAYRVFDPRAAIDAGLLLASKLGLPETKLPPFIENLFSKTFGGQGADAVLASRVALENVVGSNAVENIAKNFKLKTVLGEEIDGPTLLRWMKEDGIIKGASEASDRIQRDVERELVQNRASSTAKRVAGGLVRGIVGVPSKVEDYGRAMNYIMGLRMGYTRSGASQAVNRALFDYGRGLSEFENRVLRRLVPFYSYQAFAVPLVARNAFEKPGALGAPGKVYDLLGKIFAGDELNPAERESLPGYLVDQPTVFRGFDPEGKATFNVLSGLSPLDVVNLIEVNKTTGQIDFQATARKSVAATLSPFVKAPLEAIGGKQFFTDQTIEEGGKIGNLSEGLAAKLPQFVKDSIGWEDRQNPTTGKVTTFINPYLAYAVMNYVPALRTYIKPLDADKTALEKTMDLLFGIGTAKADLREESTRRLKDDFAQVNEARARIRRAVSIGSKNEMEKAQDDYARLIELTGRRQALRAGEIRGGPEAAGGLGSEIAPQE